MIDSLGQLVDSLVLCDPDTPQAEELRHAIESILMGALASGGRSGGEALVESLEAHGYTLDRLDSLPCIWRVGVPHSRLLEIWFTGGADPVVAAASYRADSKADEKQKSPDSKAHAAFYSRYEELCSLGLQDSPEDDDDRLLFLVAELEADVNNGGFGQYIENKGSQTAAELVEILETIKAKRTATWLSSALAAPVDSPQIEALDQQFFENSEDLASLVMGYLGDR